MAVFNFRIGIGWIKGCYQQSFGLVELDRLGVGRRLYGKCC